MKDIPSLMVEWLRMVEVYFNKNDIKVPRERETYPLRDVWVVQKNKWIHLQEAVAWEELANRTFVPDQSYCWSIVDQDQSTGAARERRQTFIWKYLESGIRGGTALRSVIL